MNTFVIMVSSKLKLAAVGTIVGLLMYLLTWISFHPLQVSVITASLESDKQNERHAFNTNITELAMKQHDVTMNRYEQNEYGNIIKSFAMGLRQNSIIDIQPHGAASGCVICESNANMTDVQLSTVSLLSTAFVELGHVTVVIVTYNSRGQRKHTGGDVIVVWAEQVGGDGRVPGQVTDHVNGTYSGVVRMVWSGNTVVKAKLLSAAGNTCRRWNSILTYRNSMFSLRKSWGILAEYRSKSLKDKTRCGTSDYIYGLRAVCNFTELNDGQHWYCGAPVTAGLTCGHVYSFGTGPFDRKNIIRNQPESELVLKPGHGVFQQTASLHAIHNNTHSRELCVRQHRAQTWTRGIPLGFTVDGQWHVDECDSHIELTVQSYRKCLANKRVYIIGDSTVRQYMEYFLHIVLGLKTVRLNDVTDRQHRIYTMGGRFENYNITIDYKKHAMPFHNPDFPPDGIASIVTEIDKLSENNIEGESEYLIINYNIHLQAHPPEEFDARIRNISMAVKRLLLQKPSITVFFKGANIAINDLRWFDSKIAFLYTDIIDHHFHDIKDRVIYLDTWSITVAHNSQILHPIGATFTSQIQQLMTYICGLS